MKKILFISILIISIVSPCFPQGIRGTWKCTEEFLSSIGFKSGRISGQCKFKKDGTFEVKINGRKSVSYVADSYSSPQSGKFKTSPSSHRLTTVRIKGTYQIENDSISTTVTPDGVFCYIETGDYPEPVNISDSKMTMDLKDIEQQIFENRVSEAEEQTNNIKEKMLKFWQWEKEPVRMTKRHLMIGYKAMFKK